MKLSPTQKAEARLFLTGQAIAGILAGSMRFEIQAYYTIRGIEPAKGFADQAIAIADEAVALLEKEDEPTSAPVTPPPCVVESEPTKKLKARKPRA